MKDVNTSDVMTYVSRATIIIPVVILIVAIGLFINTKFQQASTLYSLSKNKPSISSMDQKALLEASVSANTATESMKLDLEGPLVCQFSTNDATYSAQIKSKNVYVQKSEKNKKSTYVLNGDCVYMWENKSVSGTKMCGVGQYVGIIGMMSQFGVLNVDSILSMVRQYSPDTKVPATPTIDSALKNCKKIEVQDTVFTIPKGITFKEAQTAAQ